MHGLRLRCWIASSLPLLVSFAACSDDGTDLIEDACRVIAGECGVVSSSSECIDLLGSESGRCLECIAGAGCDYVAVCDTDVCRLPRELTR